MSFYSVVIPAYNEEEYIGRCLESLVRQNTNMKFEVIVVDNGSTDGTVRIAETFHDRLALSVAHEEMKSRGAARGKGFSLAKGDIILSTDADTEVPSDWIERMTEAFSNARVVATTGTCHIEDQSALSNSIFNMIQPIAMVLHRMVFGAYWLTGSNFAIRKSTYRESGGFDASRKSQEDTELGHRVKKLGVIRIIRSASVRTSGRRFKKNIIVGLLDYAINFIKQYALRIKNLDMDDVR